MPKLRIQLRGQVFLISNQTVGDLPDEDWVRVAFVRRLRDTQKRFHFALYGFSLTRRGYELVLGAAEDNGLADVLQLLQSSFARDVNRVLKRSGALFRRRYQDKVLVGDRALEETVARVISTDAVISSLPITDGGRLQDVHPCIECDPVVQLPPRFATPASERFADACARWSARVAEMNEQPAELVSGAKCIAESWVDLFRFETWRSSVVKAYIEPASRYAAGLVMTPFPRGTHPPSRAPEPARERARTRPPVRRRGQHIPAHRATGRIPRERLRALYQPSLRLIHGFAGDPG